MPFPDNAQFNRGRAYGPDGTFLGALCRVCGEETPADDLVASRREPTGRTRTCRACHRQANAAAVPAARAAWSARSPQEIDADWDRLRAATGGRKRCTRCKELKPKTGYVRNRAMPDGRSSECRVCVSATQAARRGS